MNTLKIFFFVLFSILFNRIYAQGTELRYSDESNNNTIEKKNTRFMPGSWVLSGGFGPSTGTRLYVQGLIGNDDLTSFTKIGIIHTKAEYAIYDWLGVGMVCNYVRFQGNARDIFEYKSALFYQSLALSLRLNLHYYTNNKLDLYLGGGLGYKYNQFDFVTQNPNYTPMDNFLIPISMECTAGLRYYLTNNIGLYVELGPAKSLIQSGLCISIRSNKL